MGWRLLKCPACGGNLDIETDRDILFCPHCEAKLMKEDDRIVIEHVERKIDETENRRIDFEAKKFDDERIKKRLFRRVSGIAVVALAVLQLIPKMGYMDQTVLNGILFIVVAYSFLASL